jgi:hypothetical protein
MEVSFRMAGSKFGGSLADQPWIHPKAVREGF